MQTRNMNAFFLALVIAVAGCAQDGGGEHDHDNAELRADLERLENEIGKLEFRIFQLENAGPGEAEPAPEAPQPTTEMPDPVDDSGRYDLTPVE